jgi:endonuclease/exonuclease/phosphatase (EEP) superfamily protein YafD
VNSLFKNQAKNDIADFSYFLLLAITTSIIAAFFSRYHWFFNLFDHLWIYYLFTSLITSALFIFLKFYLKSFFSLAILFICMFVLFKTKPDTASPNLKKKFTLYYHNINSANSSLNNLANTIINSKADIICLVEVTPLIDVFLQEKFKNYPHNYSIPRNDNFGFLISSIQKINILQVYEREGIPIFIKFSLENNNLKIYLVHLPPPLWREAFETQRETLDLITADIHKNKTESYIIVGDLNMTPESSIFEDFYNQLSPQYYIGKTFNQGTWPSFMPPFLRLQLDHVLSNQKFSMAIGPASGSDHKSLIVKMNKGQE